MDRKKLMACLVAAIAPVVSAKQNSGSEVKGKNVSSSSSSVDSGSNVEVSESLKSELVNRIGSDVVPDMDTLKNLSGYDGSVFGIMLKDNEFKKFLSDAFKSQENIDVELISREVLKKFRPIWRDSVASDLKGTVNHIVYGLYNDSGLTSKGCYFSFGDPRDEQRESFFERLGGKYFYDFAELSEGGVKALKDASDDTEFKAVLLSTVLSHLIISDFDKLKGKEIGEKSLVDIMSEILLSRYLEGTQYSLENVPLSLSKLCYKIVDDGMKDYVMKLDIPWFKTAKECAHKNFAGIAWDGCVGKDLLRGVGNIFDSAQPKFKSSGKLSDGTKIDGKKRSLKLKFVRRSQTLN